MRLRKSILPKRGGGVGCCCCRVSRSLKIPPGKSSHTCRQSPSDPSRHRLDSQMLLPPARWPGAGFTGSEHEVGEASSSRPPPAESVSLLCRRQRRRDDKPIGYKYLHLKQPICFQWDSFARRFGLKSRPSEPHPQQPSPTPPHLQRHSATQRGDARVAGAQEGGGMPWAPASARIRRAALSRPAALHSSRGNERIPHRRSPIAEEAQD